jgi:hypothetical protein
VGQSVARNQAELVQLVTAQGGAAAGQEFQAAWQNHVDVLARYATALQAKDTAAQQQARGEYVDAEARLARSFSTVTGGTVPLPALTQAATMHGEHLLDQADAFANGGYDTAYSIQREAFGTWWWPQTCSPRGRRAPRGCRPRSSTPPAHAADGHVEPPGPAHGADGAGDARRHDRSPDFPAAAGRST